MSCNLKTVPGMMSLFPARYSVDRHTDMDRIFSIHSENGSIFTLKPLDRESTPWHNITVTATEISKLEIHPSEHIIFHQRLKIIALSKLFPERDDFIIRTERNYLKCVGVLTYFKDYQIFIHFKLGFLLHLTVE